MIWPFARRAPEPDSAPAPVPPERIPRELAAQLDAATVSFRNGPEPDQVRTIVHVPGLTAFYWKDGEDIAARLGRALDLPEATAERAAAMLAAVIAREEREWARARRAEGPGRSWVWDW